MVPQDLVAGHRRMLSSASSATSSSDNPATGLSLSLLEDT
jgi:hypothetical protein